MLDLWLQPATEEAIRWANSHASDLDEAETGRWRRFHRSASRDLFLLAHVVTRQILSSYGKPGPAEWRFDRSEHGRPELVDGPPGLRFNISHTEGMVAVLMHGDHDAGVDVESPWRATNTASVSKRVFTPAERSAMFALPVDEQADRFYQLWTLKESFIKAKGKGFAMPLSKFGFAIGDDGSIEFSCDPSLDPNPAAWSFSTVRSESGHIVSVGSQSTHPLVLRSLTLNSER